MFRELKQALTWDSDFEAGWRRHVETLPTGSEHWSWTRRIAEKKAYWREQGRRRSLPAAEAVCTGLLEVIDGIYRETHDRNGQHEVFLGFAANLYYAISQSYDGGPYIQPEEKLPDRWKPFYAEYRERQVDKEFNLIRRAREIEADRFPRAEIKAAWARLLAGDVPPEVKRIWRAASSRRKSGHAIAEAAGVSIKDFVFWMVVFRDHGMMSEQIVQGEHLYVNQEVFLLNNPELSADTRRLVERLAA